MGKIFGRIGALIIALLFLVTSLGFSVLVIWQQHQQSRRNSSNSTNSQTASQALQSCTIGSATGSAEKVPPIYKTANVPRKLVVTDLITGTGPATKNGDCLQVKYLGTLAKSGKKFDGNFEKPELLKFQVGVGSVIPGWDQGLVGMKAGGERRLVIPAVLGYGKQGAGTDIPPNSDLVFDVKLVKIGQ